MDNLCLGPRRVPFSSIGTITPTGPLTMWIGRNPHWRELRPRDDNRRLTRFRDFMNRIVVCGLQPASFRVESSGEDALLQRDAGNFADWYRHVLLEHPDVVPGFTKALEEVVDGFRSIRLERVGQETRALMVTFDEAEHGYELRFDELSDGQRVLIVLYGLILSR